jgi:DGQHR domain-containing protein
MAKKTSKGTKKTSKPKRAGASYTCLRFVQNGVTMYLFAAKASELFDSLAINRRVEDKDEGYQRTLSLSRVKSIVKYVERKRAIPMSIVVSYDNAVYDTTTHILKIPAGNNVGWVIDGQHRLAGAHLAATQGLDVQLPVVAFIGLSFKEQVEQFVTINREAKGVPTSLYLDLLGILPNKSPQDAAKERAADIAAELRHDEESPFANRIVVTTSPKEGQISLVNFVRKVAPLLLQDRGILHIYTEKEQRAVIWNYFKALQTVFPQEYDKKNTVFFKTIGFGGLWNAFPTFFSLCLTNYHGFEVKDAVRIFQKISNFDYAGWRGLGTGNQAETQAGEDLKASLLFAFQDQAATMLRV